MVHILDEIHVPALHLPELLARLDTMYLPGCSARGLQPLQRWVSPPVSIEGVTPRLWLLWQVADVAAYYGMRLGQDAHVVAFWQHVDGLCTQRARHILGALPPSTQPQPIAEAAHAL